MVLADIHSLDMMSVTIKDTIKVSGRTLWDFTPNHRPFQCAAFVVEADVVCEDVVMLASRAIDGLLGQQGQLLGCGNLIGVFLRSVATFVRLGHRPVPAIGIGGINRIAGIVALMVE